MNILFIGDIFGSAGRRIVSDHLQDIAATNRIDLTIANAENAAGGFGLTPSIAEELFALGIDVLTSGNHIWDKRELFEYLDRQPRLVRPANYPEAPGRGVAVVRTLSGVDCAVINLQGRKSGYALHRLSVSQSRRNPGRPGSCHPREVCGFPRRSDQ